LPSKLCEEKNLPETCGDCPSPKEGRRSRDGKIRPGLSRFANGQDNSGAGDGKIRHRDLLWRIGIRYSFEYII